ncbi:MAG: DUF3488 domain-containing transglutaminase family protein, partial [Desulfobacterales bacterium]|nr:DUF3488 domain-containing transglutaminase family protein [Desulfobacterales bacterium]
VLPPWIMGWCGACWGYALLAARLGWPWPGKWIRAALSVGGFLGALYFFGGVDRETGVGLICLLASLKPLEIRTHRDRMVTLFLSYFLIITCLLFSGGLAIMLYMVLSTLLTTAVLIHLHRPRARSRENVFLSARIMVQALPLVMVLFLLFPRFQGGFWRLPRSTRGVSGFSERLAPGDVASLARGRGVAFRVRFKEEIPPPASLYWRGLVFWSYDGRQWLPGARFPGSAARITGENPVSYTITLEPHQREWLFALDIPYTSIGAWISRTAGHTLRYRRKVKRRMSYTLDSYTRYTIDPNDPWRQRGLALPEQGDPGARALGRKLLSMGETPREIMDAGLMFFRENAFRYTLDPGSLTGDRIDDFLFNTREGYCEHFASAYAFLMRAAGIPARIVAGYQGGEMNPYGDYLVIRQSDAHAWVEVWLGEEGWVRVDPTAAAVPERVEMGAERALPEADRLKWFAGVLPAPFDAWLKKARFGWDALNTQWTRWVMGYTPYRQKKLLSLIGISAWNMGGRLLWLLAALSLIAAPVAVYCARIFKKTAVKTDAIQAVYLKFCDKTARIGVSRAPWSGPLDFARQISRQRGEIAGPAREIIDLYIRLRYDRKGDKDDLKRLRRLVRRFSPRAPGRAG